ncbi:cysteine desulfurase family protein [Ktedonobacter racemifer]|uniref:Cysteine desulfurase n=1 Tax=Ktedonobacter racemifer DSM 44963 TaxID=485913 RepID=D6TX46_KTERA|nr:cysteine desulfurase family protein [Ktedonobacter racemifer]EFH84779.1 Cysteine desulfurase [Ktedonobacter racemifer DSM 44963]
MNANTRPKPIYMDYHATTPMDPRVVERMLYYMTQAFGNASSTDHTYGDEAEAAVTAAARHIATLLDTAPRNIIFTSGATESINLALQGHCNARTPRQRIAVSPTEHKAVLDTCQALQQQGKAILTWLHVDQQGRIDLDHLKRVCQTGIDLICIMAANNEIGTVAPIQEIANIAAQYNAAYFCDATQGVGKIPIDFDAAGITYLALSAHKMYGPKGSGALIVQPGANLLPLIHGGGHQQGMRSGTLNVPGIVGLGEACKLRSQEMDQDEPVIQAKRDHLQNLLQAHIPQLVINGDLHHRLAGNLHISIPGLNNSILIAHLRHKLAISTGSACTSGIEAPSHVLQAIHLPSNLIEGALRISIGKFTTTADIINTAHILIQAQAAIAQKQ